LDDAVTKPLPASGKQTKDTGRDDGPPSSGIKGRRFAVIEDEPIIAFKIASILENEGAHVSGPAVNVDEALRMIEDADLDGALLDANLQGEPVDAIAAALARKRGPFAFVSGYGRDALPRRFDGARLLTKPFTDSELLGTAAQLIARPAVVMGLRH
jgi:CheY-like chemotaxis protein